MAARGRPKKRADERATVSLTLWMKEGNIKRFKELTRESGKTEGEFIAAMLDLVEGVPVEQSGARIMGKIIGSGGTPPHRKKTQQITVRVTERTNQRFIENLGDISPGATNGEFMVRLMKAWEYELEIQRMVEDFREKRPMTEVVKLYDEKTGYKYDYYEKMASEEARIAEAKRLNLDFEIPAPPYTSALARELMQGYETQETKALKRALADVPDIALATARAINLMREPEEEKKRLADNPYLQVAKGLFSPMPLPSTVYTPEYVSLSSGQGSDSE
ncbi:MAG: hypothetical protein AMXMBFR75_32430 [Candidatus Hinthialibacteria bacterium]